MNKYLYALVAIISLAAGTFGFMLMTQGSQQIEVEHALHYPQARPINDFIFTDESGLPFTKQDLMNNWSLVFFGYTSCPDVCPMTLQKLHFMYDELTAIADNSQVILVSVDPNRDTLEKLSQYIAYFNPAFKALRAEHDVLFPFSRSLGLMYAITDNQSTIKNQESYWVDHSASLVLINPEGKVEAVFKPEQAVGEVPHIDSKKLLSDYQKIIAMYST